jgi:hypothetical protein
LAGLPEILPDAHGFILPDRQTIARNCKWLMDTSLEEKGLTSRLSAGGNDGIAPER